MSSTEKTLDDLYAEYGPQKLFMFSKVCEAGANLFGAHPNEILRLLARATPDELAAAYTVTKALHLIGVLVLREVDRAFAEHLSQDPLNPEVDLTFAPQTYEAVKRVHAKAEADAAIARAMFVPGPSSLQ